MSATIWILAFFGLCAVTLAWSLCAISKREEDRPESWLTDALDEPMAPLDAGGVVRFVDTPPRLCADSDPEFRWTAPGDPLLAVRDDLLRRQQRRQADIDIYWAGRRGKSRDVPPAA